MSWLELCRVNGPGLTLCALASSREHPCGSISLSTTDIRVVSACADCGPDSDAFGALWRGSDCGNRSLQPAVFRPGSVTPPQDCDELCTANEFNYCMYSPPSGSCVGVQEFVEGACFPATNDASWVHWRVCGVAIITPRCGILAARSLLWIAVTLLPCNAENALL